MDAVDEEIRATKEMIPILETLPESVTVNGKEYPVVTDYLDWIRFEQLIETDEVTDEEKAILMLEWFVDVPDNIPEAIKALVWFYIGGEEIKKSGEHSSGKVYDYKKDAGLIYAGFRQAYGINLATCTLHWWEFRALLSGLPDDTRMSQIMNIRGTDTSKMGKEQKAHYEKLKKLCAIEGVKHTPQTLEERDAAFLARVKKRG